MGKVDTLVGLQWGSEGKGKISAYLSKEYGAVVRSGGPQAGHTFYYKNQKYVNRQIPCGVFSDCNLYIGPAGIINLGILEKEIKKYNLKPDYLTIDGKAVVITKEHIDLEEKSSLKNRLASTCEGVGAAQSDKVWRKAIPFKEYIENHWLKGYLGNVTDKIHSHIKNDEDILIEGTQGFGLCLTHGEYPFVTSRDVTSSALLNEVGVSPKSHGKTIGVLRTYPIRVGGNSGNTGSEEITWEEIQKRSGSLELIQEYTTVTKKLRRVFEQSYEELKKAIKVNEPDELALMFLDYINSEDFGKNSFEELSSISQNYILELEDKLKVPIILIGTGPKENQIIDRR